MARAAGASPSSTWPTSPGRRPGTSPTSRPAARHRAARWCCGWRRRLTSRSPTATASCSPPDTPRSTTTPGTARQRRDSCSNLLDLVLAAHDPWPALVLDGQFDVLATNRGCDRLTALVDPDLLDPPVNVVRATLHPRGLARSITNLPAWRAHLLRQVRRHLAATPTDAGPAGAAATRPRRTRRRGPRANRTPARPSRCRLSCASTESSWPLLHGVDVRHATGRRRQRAGHRDLPPRGRRHASVALTVSSPDWVTRPALAVAPSAAPRSRRDRRDRRRRRR